jgi:UDP-N-acetyl-D-mannosaminuronic acid transferase (WecB/TagA/CpsF family)
MSLDNNFMKQIIINKEPREVLSKGKFTYINLYNYSFVRNHLIFFDGVYFDGVGLLNIYRFLKLRRVKRFSPDNTSLMPIIKETFNNFIVYGGKFEENTSFCSNYLEGKSILYNNDGYSDHKLVISEINETINKLSGNDRCIILIGLGSPKQEIIASAINLKQKNITLLTIGGYISQHHVRPEYFPFIINKLQLRMPYRLIKEGLWKRLPKYWTGFVLFVRDVLIRNRFK